ncbi:hypothetical protein Tco_0557582, partial [Tanacetum coccineum]
RAKLSTDRPDEGTAEKKEQHLRESASPTAPTVTSTPTPTSREPTVFMTPLLPKEDFLLNKDLKLSEINLL